MVDGSTPTSLEREGRLRAGQNDRVLSRRLRHLAATAAVLGLAVVAAPAAAPAAIASERTATASAVRTASTTASAQASGSPFELTSSSNPGKPIRWLACTPIEYRINPASMPSGMTATVRHAMDVLAKQTGVRFRYAGRTSHTYASTSHADTPTIYLAFTKKTRVAGQPFGVAGGAIGLGGPAGAAYSDGTRTIEAMTYGRVLLSSRFDGARTGAGATWQALILHEVGHALNLAHRGGAASMMSPVLTSASPATFTAAEVRSLKKVLQVSGCDYAAWSRL